jgi:hypothetical protein
MLCQFCLQPTQTNPISFQKKGLSVFGSDTTAADIPETAYTLAPGPAMLTGTYRWSSKKRCKMV